MEDGTDKRRYRLIVPTGVRSSDRVNRDYFVAVGFVDEDLEVRRCGSFDPDLDLGACCGLH